MAGSFGRFVLSAASTVGRTRNSSVVDRSVAPDMAVGARWYVRNHGCRARLRRAHPQGFGPLRGVPGRGRPLATGADVPRLGRRRSALAPHRGAAVLGRDRARPARTIPTRPRRPSPTAPTTSRRFSRCSRRDRRRSSTRSRRPPARPRCGPGPTITRVDFVRRRQAHEALIHRLDAELVAGDPTPVDRDLASDGVDEVLTIVHGELPSWATFTPDGTVGTVETSDTDRTWRSCSAASREPARLREALRHRLARGRRSPTRTRVHPAGTRPPRRVAVGARTGREPPRRR